MQQTAPLTKEQRREIKRLQGEIRALESMNAWLATTDINPIAIERNKANIAEYEARLATYGDAVVWKRPLTEREYEANFYK